MRVSLAFVVFFTFVGIFLSIYLYFHQVEIQRERFKHSFDYQTQKGFAGVKNQFSKFYYHLDNLANFFKASSYVDQSEFTLFTRNLIQKNKVSALCWRNNDQKEKYSLYSNLIAKENSLCQEGSILEPIKTISTNESLYIILTKGVTSLGGQSGLLIMIIESQLITSLSDIRDHNEFLIINDSNYQNVITIDLSTGKKSPKEVYSIQNDEIHNLYDTLESNGIFITYLAKTKKSTHLDDDVKIYLIISVLGIFLTLSLSFIMFKLIKEEEQIKAKVYRQTKEIERSHQELQKQKTIAFHKTKLASLGEMAAGVAHEINNPLAIISGGATIISRLNSGCEKTKEHLNRIQKSTDRISKIVKGLKRFSRSQNEISLAKKSLIELIEECIEMSSIKASKSSIKITSLIKNDVTLLIDQSQIEQIIINLIANAIDANSEENTPWVEISYAETEKFDEIIIKDSGLGIDQELIEKIFDPFFTTKDVGKGTGLGLSISKGIAQDHGGDLIYKTIDGHTAFVLCIPKKKAKDSNVA